VTLSRNQGIRATGADWVVFQDDDVVPDAELLEAYSRAIETHAADSPPPLAFVGMIRFPRPYNAFTRALRMSGVTNAFEIAGACTAWSWSSSVE
jgi:GT2 family glycosyltransferase